MQKVKERCRTGRLGPTPEFANVQGSDEGDLNAAKFGGSGKRAAAEAKKQRARAFAPECLKRHWNIFMENRPRRSRAQDLPVSESYGIFRMSPSVNESQRSNLLTAIKDISYKSNSRRDFAIFHPEASP